MLFRCSQWTARLLIRERRARRIELPLRFTRNAIQTVIAQTVSGLHTRGVVEGKTEVEEEAIREQEEVVEGIVRGVVGREIKRWGVRNGGV